MRYFANGKDKQIPTDLDNNINLHLIPVVGNKKSVRVKSILNHIICVYWCTVSSFCKETITDQRVVRAGGEGRWESEEYRRSPLPSHIGENMAALISFPGSQWKREEEPQELGSVQIPSPQIHLLVLGFLSVLLLGPLSSPHVTFSFRSRLLSHFAAHPLRCALLWLFLTHLAVSCQIVCVCTCLFVFLALIVWAVRTRRAPGRMAALFFHLVQKEMS